MLYRLCPAPARKIAKRVLRAQANRIPLPRRVRLAKLLVGGPAHGDAVVSPVRAWHDNMHAVVGALEAEGVDYFCVPHTDPKRSVVAVDAALRARVLGALRDRLGAAGMVIHVLDRAGRRASAQRCAVARVCQATVPVDDGYACEIEFWSTVTDKGGEAPRQVGPRGHRVGTVVRVDNPSQYVAAERLSALMPRDGERRYRTRAVYAEPSPNDVRFPIDVVYTWVDGDDPAWRSRKAQALSEDEEDSFAGLATNASRFTSRDELRYSMRSLHAFAPWVNHIFLVTDDQIPGWLDPTSPDVTLVSHKEIFGDVGRLPTFNSHAIESRLHKVPGLSEHFLYFNDDMILGRPVLPTQFFFANGLAKFFPSSSLVDVNPSAPDDAPVDAAAKNNRRVIQSRFGIQLYQKMRHVPYPLLRSVLEEIETELRAESHATASHQFRDRGDLSIPSSLAHYWAHSTGRSVPGSIGHVYIDLGRLLAPVMLARLVRRRDVDVFCLNDTDSAPGELAEQAAMVRDFMETYFPLKAPWELADRVDLGSG